MTRPSNPSTPAFARIFCSGPDCGLVELTQAQYDYAMDRPDETWRCPQCGNFDCDFDDEFWEGKNDPENER